MTDASGCPARLRELAGRLEGHGVESPDPKYRSARVIGLLATIPLILAISPLVGYGLGYLLDRWLSTGWVFKLIFLALGFVAGVREMLRLLKRARRDFDKL